MVTNIENSDYDKKHIIKGKMLKRNMLNFVKRLIVKICLL